MTRPARWERWVKETEIDDRAVVLESVDLPQPDRKGDYVVSREALIRLLFEAGFHPEKPVSGSGVQPGPAADSA